MNIQSNANQLASGDPPLMRRVRFKVFRGLLASWDRLFTDAAAFAGSLPPGSLISISHSSDHSDGVVTVWFWAE